ncbi:MAG: hypothetical protein QF486_04140 [Candidatus Woesearchaeota archaeon]|jgi:hypothetical protein|nr:hypothetical protein [Candidatus Woesearchaeota archaeon]MDP7181693.1 hypothetical protein [Candidatus Woesearchaeota archaeon]MDP7198782.1 hypothetical protein [Candidatus Woesearchaeota archaeon]MDP7467218.1 hypothetical protein [Candidatus Woesearchaeota archaeon]MDP7647447.1 hypothetical protein [Candidatus Woesearchaeota archaeon]|tara:strand:+ start:298 stop:624 length:327 start_codon:yes stop_codon:yes gene_type:complete
MSNHELTVLAVIAVVALGVLGMSGQFTGLAHHIEGQSPNVKGSSYIGIPTGPNVPVRAQEMPYLTQEEWNFVDYSTLPNIDIDQTPRSPAGEYTQRAAPNRAKTLHRG